MPIHLAQTPIPEITEDCERLQQYLENGPRFKPTSNEGLEKCAEVDLLIDPPLPIKQYLIPIYKKLVGRND